MAESAAVKVAEWKRNFVDELSDKFNEYPVVGVLSIKGVPARQFQQMRQILRGKAEIKVGRKNLLELAVKRASEGRPKLRELAGYLEGEAALIFTKMNPFRLWKFLNEKKVSAPAKAGDVLSKDVVIPAGETNFPPGPIVSELQRVGVKARIQAGKIVILEDCVLVRKGEKVTQEVADVLSKFGIEPKEIGFELLAAFEGGVVFPGDVLAIDEEKVKSDIVKAYTQSFTLSVEIGYPTRETIGVMVSRAYASAFTLALEASLPVAEVVPELLARAVRGMKSLAAVLASRDVNALDEELRGMVAPKAEGAKKEEAPREKPKKEEGEKEEAVGLGALFG